MGSQVSNTIPSMKNPATYRIRINGHLDANWLDRLNDMKIITMREGDTPETTTLEGRLIDQAAIIGVLNTLYDLGLPLVSVECLDCTNTKKEQGGK
jgi:hypothetical protein